MCPRLPHEVGAAPQESESGNSAPLPRRNKIAAFHARVAQEEAPPRHLGHRQWHHEPPGHPWGQVGPAMEKWKVYGRGHYSHVT